MKKGTFIVGILFMILFLSGQELQHEVLTINVEVTTRVFKGDKFIDNLTIDDFEVYEDGILQKIEAVYLIKKTSIERQEENRKFKPKTQRHFYLFFGISDYTPMLGTAVDFFIQNVITSRDSFTVVTPLRTYQMKSRAFENIPKGEVCKQLKGIIKRDASAGHSEYKATSEEMAKLARAISAAITEGASPFGVPRGDLEFTDMSIEGLLHIYANLLKKLSHLRKIDQQKLLDFAEYLRDKKGQKYVFLFYQREFIPQIEPRLLSLSAEKFANNPEIVQTISSVFELYRRGIPFDVDTVKRAYSDSLISIHFLFITYQSKQIFGVHMEEHSEDIYTAFNEMAMATGGFADSSLNPDFLMRKAVEASENYYLLYYSPKSYKVDGKFHNIKVKVKNTNYRITSRAGYFAN